MRAVVDQDHAPLERWADMADAETAVVWDARMGGYPAALLGIESRPVPRDGFVPADGPDRGPRARCSRIRRRRSRGPSTPPAATARSSCWRTCPASTDRRSRMRNLQLEYGAEIGRAIVNFDGPIVFCVISRYHGGAFVVFSSALNEGMEVVALEGSYASVIGGAPAAAVVFPREVNARTAAIRGCGNWKRNWRRPQTTPSVPTCGIELASQRAAVRSAKLGEVASEFEAIHNIKRAQHVGSVHTIIPAARVAALDHRRGRAGHGQGHRRRSGSR